MITQLEMPLQMPVRTARRSTPMMKSFVMKRLGEVGFMDKPIPVPGPYDAVVRTTHALICTSDTHTLKGAIGDRSNLTLGHEAVGVVQEAGIEVRRLKPGDRVVAGAITPDFTCTNCQRGYSSQCGGALGGWKFANIKDGVFAQFFHVNNADANLALIPPGISEEAAVYCCDMLSTGIMGAERANIPVGGTVAVFAQGPVGLMATAGARLCGAGMIIAVETVEKRKRLALDYGADVVVDYTQGDTVAQIMSLTGGQGVDSAIECLGSQKTFEACIKATKPGGTISVAGYFGEEEYVKIPRIEWGVGMGDKTIRTGLCPGGRVRMERMLRLIQTGRIDPTRMTTHRFPFDRIEEAFRLMQTGKDGIIKPLITF